MPIITPSSGGSGVGALIFNSVLGADTASIDTGANGIGQSFNVLEVFILARTDEAVANSHVVITLNNDASAIYDAVFVEGFNGVAQSANVLAGAGWVLLAAGASATAGVYSPIHLTFPFYAQTTAQKSGNALTSTVGTAAATNDVRTTGLNYRSTTAISRLKVANSGGTVLKAGSGLLIYGR